MKTKSWFRVVVDAGGKVKDCKPVSSAGDAETSVFYVLAASAQAAAKAAINRHAANLLAARRAKYRSEGRCDCGSMRDRPGLKTCSRCAERHAVHNARLALKAKGVPVPPIDRREVLQEKRQQEADRVRFETLAEVQRAYHKMRGQGATFERWLGAQIEKLTGRKVA